VYDPLGVDFGFLVGTDGVWAYGLLVCCADMGRRATSTGPGRGSLLPPRALMLPPLSALNGGGEWLFQLAPQTYVGWLSVVVKTYRLVYISLSLMTSSRGVTGAFLRGADEGRCCLLYCCESALSQEDSRVWR
jgi:hypothetical protein